MNEELVVAPGWGGVWGALCLEEGVVLGLSVGAGPSRPPLLLSKTQVLTGAALLSTQSHG